MLTLPPAGHLFFTLLLYLTSQIYSIYHPVVYLNKWSLTVDPAHRKAYKNTDLKNTDNLLPSSCVSFRRMLRWCVMWSVAWRTQSLTPPSCSPPWFVCGPTQASRSVSAAPASTSSTTQRSSTYSTCGHLFVFWLSDLISVSSVYLIYLYLQTGCLLPHESTMKVSNIKHAEWIGCPLHGQSISCRVVCVIRLCYINCCRVKCENYLRYWFQVSVWVWTGIVYSDK